MTKDDIRFIRLHLNTLAETAKLEGIYSLSSELNPKNKELRGKLANAQSAVKEEIERTLIEVSKL